MLNTMICIIMANLSTPQMIVTHCIDCVKVILFFFLHSPWFHNFDWWKTKCVSIIYTCSNNYNRYNYYNNYYAQVVFQNQLDSLKICIESSFWNRSDCFDLVLYSYRSPVLHLYSFLYPKNKLPVSLYIDTILNIYRRTGFKCVVKWLCFQDFEEIAFLITAFVTCNQLGHIS